MSSSDDRFASIAGGGLTKRRPVIAAVPDPDPDPDPGIVIGGPSTDPTPEVPKQTEPRTEPPTKSATGQRSRPKSEETGGTRRAAFRFPEDVDAKLRARVDQDHTSKLHVILDAIEHVVAAGTTLDFTFTAPAHAESALFTRPRPTGKATPTVPAEIALDAASLGTIDKLAEKAGAPTRTAFVLACLGEYL